MKIPFSAALKNKAISLQKKVEPKLDLSGPPPPRNPGNKLTAYSDDGPSQNQLLYVKPMENYEHQTDNLTFEYDSTTEPVPVPLKPFKMCNSHDFKGKPLYARSYKIQANCSPYEVESDNVSLDSRFYTNLQSLRLSESDTSSSVDDIPINFNLDNFQIPWGCISLTATQALFGDYTNIFSVVGGLGLLYFSKKEVKKELISIKEDATYLYINKRRLGILIVSFIIETHRAGTVNIDHPNIDDFV